jgi:hypothetical protein
MPRAYLLKARLCSKFERFIDVIAACNYAMMSHVQDDPLPCPRGDGARQDVKA